MGRMPLTLSFIASCRRAIQVARERAVRWAPWLARLNSLSGLVAASEGRAFLMARAAAAEVLRFDEHAAAVGVAGSDAGSRTVSAKGRSSSPPKGGSKPPVTPPKKVGTVETAPASVPENGAAPDLSSSPPILALAHLARSAQLACRCWSNHAFHSPSLILIPLINLTLTLPCQILAI